MSLAAVLAWDVDSLLFPLFLAQDHYVSGYTSLPQRAIHVIKMSRFTAIHEWCIAKLFVVSMFSCVTVLQHVGGVFFVKKVPQEQILSLDLSLKSGCSLACSVVGAQ